jgi:hypothetical protein
MSLANTSLTKALSNFHVIIAPDSTVSPDEANVTPVFLKPPYDLKTLNGSIEQPLFSSNYLEFSIKTLPPQDYYSARFDKRTNIPIVIIFESSEAILARPASLVTFVLMYRLEMHLVLAGILFLLILYFFVCLLLPGQPQDVNRQPDQSHNISP